MNATLIHVEIMPNVRMKKASSSVHVMRAMSESTLCVSVC